MVNNKPAIELDVRGEICPEPLIKATKAMEMASHEQDINLLTDFLPAVLTVTNAALKGLWDIKIQHVGPKEWKLTLNRSS